MSPWIQRCVVIKADVLKVFPFGHRSFAVLSGLCHSPFRLCIFVTSSHRRGKKYHWVQTVFAPRDFLSVKTHPENCGKTPKLLWNSPMTSSSSQNGIPWCIQNGKVNCHTWGQHRKIGKSKKMEIQFFFLSKTCIVDKF